MVFIEVTLAESLSMILTPLEKRLPKSAMAHNVVKMSISQMLPESVSSKVYSFEGKLLEKGPFDDLFIVIIQYRKTYSDYAIILSTPNNPTSEMKLGFETLVDWSLPICFAAVDLNYSGFVAELCSKHGKLSFVDRCDFMTMSSADARNVRLNESLLNPSIEVRELSPPDAELVAKRWQFSQEGTPELLAESIERTGSAGVFENGRLVSWVVIFAVGSTNALFTEVDHRGKGYGELTMQKVLQVAGQRGLVPNVQVQIGNSTSSHLMNKVGLKYSHLIEWVIYNP